MGIRNKIIHTDVSAIVLAPLELITYHNFRTAVSKVYKYKNLNITPPKFHLQLFCTVRCMHMCVHIDR